MPRRLWQPHCLGVLGPAGCVAPAAASGAAPRRRRAAGGGDGHLAGVPHALRQRRRKLLLHDVGALLGVRWHGQPRRVACPLPAGSLGQACWRCWCWLPWCRGWRGPTPRCCRPARAPGSSSAPPPAWWCCSSPSRWTHDCRRSPSPPATTRLRRFPTGQAPSQVRSTTSSHPRHARLRHADDCRTGTSGRTGHRDGESRSGWLHTPSTAATVLVLVYHVAGRGPLPGRLPVMNSNAQSARGALRTVVEDVGVSTLPATVWPGWATVCCQGDDAMASTAVGR